MSSLVAFGHGSIARWRSVIWRAEIRQLQWQMDAGRRAFLPRALCDSATVRPPCPVTARPTPSPCRLQCRQRFFLVRDEVYRRAAMAQSHKRDVLRRTLLADDRQTSFAVNFVRRHAEKLAALGGISAASCTPLVRDNV